MRSRLTTIPRDSARATRLAWLVSFLATLAVIAILALAKSAQAETVGAPGHSTLPPFSLATGDEEEGEEEFEPGSEEEDEEGEGEEKGEAGGTEDADKPPSQCLLRTARATMVAYGSQSKVRLQVNYTSFAPAEVAIEYRLHDGKGSMSLGHEQEHFAFNGVFRDTDRLDKGHMARVMAAKEFTVELRALTAPKSCHRYGVRHLQGKRSAAGNVTWSQAGSIFGT